MKRFSAMSAVLFASALTLVGSGRAAAQGPAGRGRAPMATVSVLPDSLGATIPRDFMGFSVEVSTMGQGIGAFNSPGAAGAAAEPAEQILYALGHPGAPNEGFFRFMHNLGDGILRLGGNSQDNSCWDKEHAPHPEGCDAALSDGDLALFAQAARAGGWRLILGINLKQNAPAWALGEVADGVKRLIPPELVFALEPGNEPDLFFRTPYRARTYAPGDQVKEFLAYIGALQADSFARAFPVVGPATCCGWRNAHDLGVFADGVGRDKLKWITVHNYSATTCNGQTVTIARLLSAELMDQFNREARPLVAVARAHGLPIAMAETNSASCGGMPGVSNAFASTLWGLDFAFSQAQDGFANVDFHFSYRPGGGSSYNPVDTYGRQDSTGRWHYRNVAEPLYYAMYLMSHEAAGERLLPATTRSRANIRAYAVADCAGCAVKVFVLNKDTIASGPVRVHLGRGMGDASLLMLDAPRLASGAGEVCFGGQQFDSDGRIGTPTTVAVKADASGDYTFSLPNAAIALLTVQPRAPR
jgi:hypothetical protein